MKKCVFILLLILTSCKLFESKDTTAPAVNLTIAGGNEISRGVTLYLDIEDDSIIDYVDIIIDDTTAATVTSNFDTIRFDVTPFADESEHQLYAKVADSEGNIGESEKIDVVITEYPGWRAYKDVPVVSWAFTVDENGLIWSGFYDITIFDPNTGGIRILNFENSPLVQGDIGNIKVVEGSRVWILNENMLFEYHYDLDKWIQDVELHSTDTWYTGLAIDSDYNVWIGQYWGNLDSVLYKYDHVNLTPFPYSQVGSITEIEVHPDGTIYLGGEPGVDAFKDGNIYSFDDYPYPQGDGTQVVIDSSGNVWSNGTYQQGGAFRFNGDYWETILFPIDVINYSHYIIPLFTSKEGTIYCQALARPNGQTLERFGIVTFNGDSWTLWNKFDCPFNEELEQGYHHYLSTNAIGESPNGDIWMVIGSQLWRYRPSLGGYP